MIELFRDVSLIPMTLVLIAFGIAWFYMACGGLYWLLHRSPLRERVARYRTQRAWPTPKQVRGEIRDGTLGISAAMLMVSASFWMGLNGFGGLYSDPHQYGLLYIPLSIVFLFLTMEVFEWAFHWACHRNAILWRIHKHHHRYANPTTFGVMADQPIDMLIKASPILWAPFLFPIWDVALLGTFLTLNFVYGTYLHAGFDFPFMPSPHSRVLLGAWHHNAHHSGSVDYNYGFFTGALDIVFGTRLTPADIAAKKPAYRCTECRNREPAAA